MGQCEGSANTALLWMVLHIQNPTEEETDNKLPFLHWPRISPNAEVAWDV